jgi:hypothetical protein
MDKSFRAIIRRAKNALKLPHRFNNHCRNALTLRGLACWDGDYEKTLSIVHDTILLGTGKKLLA